MDNSRSSSHIKPLSRKNSRILLTFFILFTVFLGYLSAIGIRSASENEAFQQAMEEFQQNSSPALLDSTEANSAVQDSSNRP